MSDWMAYGLGALGLSLLGGSLIRGELTSPPALVAPTAPPPAPGWEERVIARVSQHEGGPDSLNLNRDGAGLSFGILQWAQGTGDLGDLLGAMNRAYPSRFRAIFGPYSDELLARTSSPSMAPVNGAVLWTAPWVSRFRAAGRDPALASVQYELARRGHHWRGALQAARALGTLTERSAALTFDTAVQQGAQTAIALAKKAASEEWSHSARLRRFAALAPARFRRTTAPTRPHPSPHISWERVGDEWHAFAGTIDLFRDVTRRRQSILQDAHLSDTPIRESLHVVS